MKQVQLYFFKICFSGQEMSLPRMHKALTAHQHHINQAWWYMLVIPNIRSWRLENPKFNVIMATQQVQG